MITHIKAELPYVLLFVHGMHGNHNYSLLIINY